MSGREHRSRNNKRFIIICAALMIIFISFTGTKAESEEPEKNTDKDNISSNERDVEGKQGEQQKSGSGYRLWGRITGFISAILIVSMLFTGGYFKKPSNKLSKFLGGAKKRIALHCYLSGLLLFLSLLHAALLMYGHYSDLANEYIFFFAEPGNPSLNTGTFGLLIMFVISISGIFQKPLRKKMGNKNWRRLHLWLTVAVLVLVMIHLLWAGTTFGEPLRSIL